MKSLFLNRPSDTWKAARMAEIRVLGLFVEISWTSLFTTILRVLSYKFPSLFSYLAVGTVCVIFKGKTKLNEGVAIKKTSKSFFKKIASSLFVSFFLFLNACNYVTPESENSLPGLLENGFAIQNGILFIDKSFFGIQIDEKSKTVFVERKKWLCGEAPVNQSGFRKNTAGLDYVPRTGHCNLEFQISDDGSSLIAREVDLNQTQFNDMPLIYEIPIDKHFFYEKDVDSRGRQLNDYKAVEDRSNWQLRPFLQLNLARMTAFVRTRDISYNPSNIVRGISDIVVEKKENANYLAFSMGITVPLRDRMGGTRNVSLERRVNILEFVGTPGFKKTPYDLSVAEHMNILHILGKSADGFSDLKWAAHWDFSTPKELCLNGWPDSPTKPYKKIAIEVIEEVNQGLRDAKVIGPGQKGFVVANRQMKYHYDLRCPSLTWIDDPNLSFGAPLGIGLVNTNISTGEILWGGGVVWGGLIDSIVNDNSSVTINNMAKLTFANIAEQDSARENPYYEDIFSRMETLLNTAPLNFKSMEDLRGYDQIAQGMPVAYHKITESLKSIKNMGPEELKEKYPKADHDFIVRHLEDISEIADLEKLNGGRFTNARIQQDLFKDYSFDYGQFDTEKDFQNLLLDYGKFGTRLEKTTFEKENLSAMTNPDQAKLALMRSPRLANDLFGVYDLDNTFENHFSEWTSAIKGLGSFEKGVAAQTIVKFVTLHELGHVVGLGHQFEGNKMPEKGTVPPKIFNALKAESLRGVNYTSIMDYPNGRTEVAMSPDEMNFRVQDSLVLSYLYNQKYAGYVPGEKEFRFYDLPKNGAIPPETFDDKGGLMVKTTYMPQCSDIDASLAHSPSCRRFDMGHDAPSMVQANIDLYKETFSTRMNSFTGASGGSTGLNSMRMARATYNLVNNNRTFYDRMRYLLWNDDKYRSAFQEIVTQPEATLSFSEACVDPSLSPADWKSHFARLTLESSIDGSFSPSHLESFEEIIACGISEEKGRTLQLNDSEGEPCGFLKGRSKTGFTDADFTNIESKLHSIDIRFSEVQKLCRANTKALGVINTLLDINGPDHPTTNWEAAVSPTGLRGGNARQDFSYLLGRYETLGALPIKIAALDVLTELSSTMMWGWWRVNKPKYVDGNAGGKTGYFSLYPKEFSDIITNSIDKNIHPRGTILHPSGIIGLSNFFTGYFLRRAFHQTNEEAFKFNDKYLDEIENQTHFETELVAIMMRPDIPKDGGGKAYGFKDPEIYNTFTRESIKLSEAYVLGEGTTIVQGLGNKILVPVSKLRFISENSAFVWAIDISYDPPITADPALKKLNDYSIKTLISGVSNREFERCVHDDNGLAKFFSADNIYDPEENPNGFKGFEIPPTIAFEVQKQRVFEKSVYDAFQRYHAIHKPEQKYCEESYKGMSLIGASILSLNGLFLPQVFDYVVK